MSLNYHLHACIVCVLLPVCEQCGCLCILSVCLLLLKSQDGVLEEISFPQIKVDHRNRTVTCRAP